MTAWNASSSSTYVRAVALHKGRCKTPLSLIPSGSATGLRPDTLVQLEQLVQWCASSSVEHLLLYDRQGCLRQNAAAICKALARNATVADCTRPEARHRTFDVQLQRQKIRISMLDAQDGRAHIARVGQVLASAVRQGYLAPKEIDIALLDDKLIDSLVPAPDLMIVLGGTYCRLHGFPPWHLRLTEFYHVPSPLWSWNSTPTQLSRAHFEQALDLYSDCEMRQGK
ncbi:hypothetical protein E5Q_02629 [Mixia osmundae IAM 14324]|uniref:ditrans,polycis-polyprenyl diphosphate synthase [(2E,6E)-farnesyldiphosphate specific] n=1 Tax=Mixia osmundae (strain CBS 9802 / IAM 14324 / JCM 22182 / KY 12970) TaxID=764103 RepID=G7DZG1_MIXOS|nr:hypothetical protein E5Q_02629 [Mixia osmundae IAM 14324]